MPTQIQQKQNLNAEKFADRQKENGLFDFLFYDSPLKKNSKVETGGHQGRDLVFVPHKRTSRSGLLFFLIIVILFGIIILKVNVVNTIITYYQIIENMAR